jgi:hypothetical protein
VITMESTVLSDVMLCSPVEVYRLLEECTVSSCRTEEYTKQVASKKQADRGSACHLLHAGCLLGLLCDPEDGGSMFLPNVSKLLTDYTASHLTRQYSS